jgi:hypothetical protein
MDTTRRDLILQRWNVVQQELIPEFREETGALKEKLEKVIDTLEWQRQPLDRGCAQQQRKRPRRVASRRPGPCLSRQLAAVLRTRQTLYADLLIVAVWNILTFM